MLIRLAALACAGVFLSAAPAAAAVIDGISGPGAIWQIRVPNAWNGDLVVYAHGIEEPSKALEVNPDGFPFEAFEAFGYATITTSYRSTGWAVKDAFTDVHQLRAIFTSEVAPPDRIYLLGASMGGIVASQQAETFGSQYDGALLFCPPLSGLGAAQQYFAEVTALFDVFYPGVLGYDPANPPVDGTFDVDGMLAAAQAAVFGDPLGALQILWVMGGAVPGDGLLEQAESILTAVAFWTVYSEETNQRANGWSFDTTATVYSGSFDDAALNAAVARFASSNPALHFGERWYLPDGDLHMPTIVLANDVDPVVPASNVSGFEARVAAEGADDLLAVQTVDRFGHCALSPNEIAGAFLDLVTWVEAGLPAPDGDVTNP